MPELPEVETVARAEQVRVVGVDHPAERGGDEDVAKWPEYCDESRFKRFLRGYDEVMLLSSVRGVTPVVRLDGRELGTGPVTTAVRAAIPMRPGRPILLSGMTVPFTRSPRRALR